jgi:hypothetical protein
MNKKPISESRDVALRKSEAALRRAAQRAREVARQTGTCLVVSRNGKIHRIAPDAVAESPAQYGSETGHSR